MKRRSDAGGITLQVFSAYTEKRKLFPHAGAMSSITEWDHHGENARIGLDSRRGAGQMHSSRAQSRNKNFAGRNRARRSKTKRRRAFNKRIKLSPFPVLANETLTNTEANKGRTDVLVRYYCSEGERNRSGKRANPRKNDRRLRFHRRPLFHVLCSMALWVKCFLRVRVTKIPRRPLGRLPFLAGHSSSH